MEVREKTNGGSELIDWHLRIVRGDTIPLTGRARGQVPTFDQRLIAAAWLANRGWGKSREVVELVGEPTAAQRLELLRRLSDEDRNQLRMLLQRALTNGPSTPASDVTDGRGDENPASQEDDRELVIAENGTPVIETEPVNDAIVADDSTFEADRPLPDAAN
jgi:hypothetical protein